MGSGEISFVFDTFFNTIIYVKNVMRTGGGGGGYSLGERRGTRRVQLVREGGTRRVQLVREGGGEREERG